ncbi:hypothetical protein BU17DRAFT_61599 [Hysterangium stoloniferum]|nr:hypothetical protein BU17DRAFT_61599 [Hysterangium stoloniferum]
MAESLKRSSTGRMFHHCSPTDYDQWAALATMVGDILPYPSYVFPSQCSTNVQEHSRTGDLVREPHGSKTNLLMKVGIPYTDDKKFHSNESTMTYIDSTGKRVNTETECFTPEVLVRPNLKVAVNLHVAPFLENTSLSMAFPRSVTSLVWDSDFKITLQWDTSYGQAWIFHIIGLMTSNMAEAAAFMRQAIVVFFHEDSYLIKGRWVELCADQYSNIQYQKYWQVQVSA